MDMNGKVIHQFNENSKAEDFRDFLISLKDAAGGFKKLLVLVDNAKIHHAKIVREFCEENDITLVFLPTYSPDLNPIEQVWRMIKRAIYKGTIKGIEDIIEKVGKEFSEKTYPDTWKRWIEKFGRCLNP